MASTTIRFDDELKVQVNDKLEKLGLNLNTYVVMALKQLVAQNRVPFSLEVPEQLPMDEELYRTMVRVEAEELGLIPDTSLKVDRQKLRDKLK